MPSRSLETSHPQSLILSHHRRRQMPCASPPPSPPKTRGKLPTQEEAFRRHRARKGRDTTTKSTPTTPDAITKGEAGVVIHGIPLRKDLGKVKKWLGAANRELGKVMGIRWLRKKSLLEEGKQTSSVVLYLEKEVAIEKVRLSGRWHKCARYESERGRK
ncbi:hypothetical protein BDZ91DRAFT_791911 [Kalaharituber pfeilii]|nr:hypothetical protein BDZ91DRAFT_791911 [Kalaharituber pfeilii]